LVIHDLVGLSALPGLPVPSHRMAL